MRRSILALAAFVVVSVPAFAAAATTDLPICQSELRDGLTNLAIHRPGTGIDAALILERAVKLVEPALPPMVKVDKVPVEQNTPFYYDVLYLAERRLLPGSWKPDSIDAKTWQTMLARFESWYKVTPVDVPKPDTVGDLIDGAGVVLDRVSQAIRPAALLASDPNDPNKIAFWAIIWNWTVYPRLIVLHPRSDVNLKDGPDAALQHMGDCAVHITSYVEARAEDASKLFLATNQSRMYVVASVPSRGQHWPAEVAAGKEIDAFGYKAPMVKDLDVYAAVFDGPQVGFTKVLGLLPRLRTNMSPFRFLSYMKTP
ncbi:MAG TPA: hypothetical protein VKB31_06835 [Trueperaceae bacterium]|nr:hypothetical protein [Trueperaceae bacterium]